MLTVQGELFVKYQTGTVFIEALLNVELTTEMHTSITGMSGLMIIFEWIETDTKFL